MIKKQLEYCLLILASTIFYIFFMGYVSFFTLIFFLLLPLVSAAAALVAGRKITAELETEQAILQKHESITLRLKVKSNSVFMTVPIKVKLKIQNELLQQELNETIFLTAGPTEQVIEYMLTSQYCGKINCHIQKLYICDYLGLFSFRQKPENQKNTAAFVLPTVYPLNFCFKPADNPNTDSNAFSQTRSGDDPSELFGIREYQDGDRLSRIHWKLSGRFDRMMVKEFSLPLSDRVLLLLDLNGDKNELNGLLDVFYSISCNLLKQQIAHEIHWYDSRNDRSVNSSVTQKSDLTAALDALLFAGRQQNEPLALKTFQISDSAGNYAHIFYFCCQLPPDSSDTLFGCSLKTGNRIDIFQITETSDAFAFRQPSSSASGVYLNAINPSQIKQAMDSLLL